MDAYYMYRTPRSRSRWAEPDQVATSLEAGGMEYYPGYVSEDSITNDTALNEFINDPEFDMPMMDESVSRRHPQLQPISLQRTSVIRNPYHDGETIGLDVQLSTTVPRYYMIHFALGVIISIVYSASTFMLSMADATSPWVFFIQKTIQFGCIGYFVYTFTTVSTYKSINYSLDTLMVNWVLYSYSFLNILTYLSILITAPVAGSYVTIGLYYSKIKQVDQQLLFDSIFSTTGTGVWAADTIVLTLVAHVTFIIGITFILSYINSMNCKSIAVHALGYTYVISMLCEIAIGPISFILCRVALYGALVSVFGDAESGQKNAICIMTGINILIKLLVYPLIAYHVKYVWIRILQRYFEYSA